MFFLMWVIGALVSTLGMAVYVEFGTVSSSYFFVILYNSSRQIFSFFLLFLQGLPRSGGEQNYLEYLYRKPELLAMCCIAMYSCLLVRKRIFSVTFHVLKLTSY